MAPTDKRKKRRSTGSIYRTYRTDAAGNRVPTGWMAQIRVDDPFKSGGRYVRKRCKTREAAQEALAALQAGEGAPVRIDPHMKVADYLDRYTKVYLPVAPLGEKTKEMYKTVVTNPLKPTLADVTLTDFPRAVNEWLGRLNQSVNLRNGKPLSAGVKRKAFYVLSGALDEAVREKFLTANPLKDVKPPQDARVVVPTTSATDFDKVILPAVQGLRIEPLVIFVGLTGCRLGEALGLTWKDVDLDKATATIRRSGVGRDRTKTGRVRTVPLVADVVAALKARRSEQRADRMKMGAGWPAGQNLVFTTATGVAVDSHNARRDFVRVLKDKGLNTSRPFHSLRHGMATRLLEREVPMHVVSALLGHSTIRLTVDLYGHVEPVVHAAALEAALAPGTN